MTAMADKNNISKRQHLWKVHWNNITFSDLLKVCSEGAKNTPRKKQSPNFKILTGLVQTILFSLIQTSEFFLGQEWHLIFTLLSLPWVIENLGPNSSSVFQCACSKLGLCSKCCYTRLWMLKLYKKVVFWSNGKMVLFPSTVFHGQYWRHSIPLYLLHPHLCLLP